MAYKIIDDETALTIFEAIQEKTTRSFGRYNCQRQLPKHKINGELMFYLDELLDFAERELNQPPEETLGQVVDQGLTAWFAGLAPALQRKLGFSLKANGSHSTLIPAGKPAHDDNEASEDNAQPDTKEALKLLTQKNKTIEELTAENLRLKEAVEALAAEKVALKREITHLEQIHEELNEHAPQVQIPSGGYLSDASIQSGYMALTTHSLSGPVLPHDNNAGAASKKNKRRRKRKGAMSPVPGNGRA